MKRFALLAALVASAGLLAACGVAPVQKVNVPIPVACDAAEPARPAMPTEALSAGVDLDRFAAAAMAEIELREGYEGEVLAALRACTAPLGEAAASRPRD